MLALMEKCVQVRTYSRLHVKYMYVYPHICICDHILS